MSSPDPFESFESLLAMQARSQAGLPPVERWNPPLSGDLDMRIASDGTWYYQGGPIERQRMVVLFSGILKRESDAYFLVTPVEKWRIQVDDAPFIANQLEVERQGIEREQALVLSTNVGGRIVVGPCNELWVEERGENAEPRPYVHVRNSLNALIHRNIFYQLVDIAVNESINGRQKLGVWSLGSFYSLGDTPEEN